MTWSSSAILPPLAIFLELAGIKVIGLLGTLREAKQRGIIPEIKPILDQMCTVARFRISETLYRLILTEAGEADN